MSQEKDDKKDAAYSHYVKSNTMCNAGDAAGAITEIEKAIKLRPNNALYIFAKGMAQWEGKAFQGATDSFIHANKLRPQWVKPLCALGALAYERDRFDEATRYYETAVKIGPNVDIYTILANLYLNHNPELALVNANHALELDPTWEEAVNLRAEAMDKVQNKHE